MMSIIGTFIGGFLSGGLFIGYKAMKHQENPKNRKIVYGFQNKTNKL